MNSARRNWPMAPAPSARRYRRFRPRAVAILGVTAYRTAFAAPRAVLGRQPEDLHGSQLWVVPNPSGRNAHAPLDALAAAYREVALAAAIACASASSVRRVPRAAGAATRATAGAGTGSGSPPTPAQPSASGSAEIASAAGSAGGPPRLAHAASPGPPRWRTNGTCSQTQASHRLRPRRVDAAPLPQAKPRADAARAVRSVRTVDPTDQTQGSVDDQHPARARRGTSYQRGRQYGRQAAARVRLSVQAYQQTFAHFAGWDWPAVRREAARFEAPIGEVHARVPGGDCAASRTAPASTWPTCWRSTCAPR